MKIIIITTLIGLIGQPNQQGFIPKINVENEFGLTSSQLFNYDGLSKATSQNKIFFDNGIGYFITYQKENNEKLGSILFAPNDNKNGWMIKNIYEGDYVPFKDNECFFISSDVFVNFKDKINTTLNINEYDYRGFTYGTTIDYNRYFPVTNSVTSHLYCYDASYLQETRILNVPNYMNTQFNHKGCSPTAAAMYFSYLEDNNLNIINNSLYKNLPLKHTDNYTKVDGFINHLGVNYFDTSKESGTPLGIFKSAYDDYLDSTVYSNYELFTYNNYNEYKNSIRNAANPVHISLDLGYSYHSVLGIGYKEIHQSNGEITRFVIGNAVSNDQTIVKYYPENEVVAFRSIHR